MTIKNHLSTSRKWLIHHWKKVVLIGGGVLLLTGGGLVFADKLLDSHEDYRDYHSYQSRSDRDWKGRDFESDEAYDTDQDAFLDLEDKVTYGSLKTAIANSSLSTKEKESAQAALDKSKTQVSKVESIQKEIESLYADKLATYTSDFQKLISSHKDLWAKIDESDLQEESLEDLDPSDIADLKEEVNQSTVLSQDQKTSLLSDIDKMSQLQSAYDKALDDNASKIKELVNQLETAQNAVITSLKDNGVTDDMLRQIGWDY